MDIQLPTAEDINHGKNSHPTKIILLCINTQ